MPSRWIVWGPAAAWAVVLFLLSAWSNPTVPLFFTGSDKLMHAGLYAVLGLALGYGRVRSVEPPPHLLVILIGALYGVTDEFHQVFVRGRSPDWSDWIADVFGVVVGYFFILSVMTSRPPTSPDHGVDASR